MPLQPAAATSVTSTLMLEPELTTLPLIFTLVAALRSLTAFWTIWSGVPERDVALDVPPDPLELQAAAERAIAAASTRAGTIRMRDATDVLPLNRYGRSCP